MIGYFATTSCPTGWLLADGSNGTLDMRGVFPRGLDNGRGLDPGRIIGSYQGDAIRNITGQFVTGANGYAVSYQQGAFYNMSVGAYGHYQAGSNEYYLAGFSADRMVPTAAENRPQNVALLACQKD